MVSLLGFTLIEFIILLVIGSIVATLSISSYYYFSIKQKIKEAKEKYISALELVREKARGNDVSQCQGSDSDLNINLKEYILKVIGGSNIEIYPICIDSFGKSFTSNKKIKINLKKISLYPNTLDLTFEKGSGNIKNLGNNIDKCVEIKSKEAISNCLQVCINQYAAISEKKCN